MEKSENNNYFIFLENIKENIFKAKNPENNKIYFVKKIKSKKLSLSQIREIKLLKRIQNITKNNNIIHIENILYYNNNHLLYLVFPYYEYSLKKLICNNFIFTDLQIFYIIKQLLTALDYLHLNNIIHRSVCPDNILSDKSGNLVLTGFENSRNMSDNMTNFDNLYYTAPEILLGDINYDYKVDSWSVGCIMVEMKTHCVLFNETDEIKQTQLILDVLGSPDIKYPWNDLYEVEKYKKQESFEVLFQRKINKDFDNEVIDNKLFDGKFLEVIKELLILNKENRLSAHNALKLTGFMFEGPVECNFNI